jgi:hypothetical protein
MYKIVFYVPETHLELVKQAVFNSGAGKIGDYDQCCWQVLGQGQFRPLAGAQPFIGAVSLDVNAPAEEVMEYRVELVCDDAYIQQAIHALKQAHPYEEPAMDVWQLETFQ